MRLIQVTMTGSPIPIMPAVVAPTPTLHFSSVTLQNNAAAQMRWGDSTVTATRGIVLSPGGSYTLTPSLMYTSDMYELYVVGTIGNVLDIVVFD
jgi:hypothetical protein